MSYIDKADLQSTYSSELLDQLINSDDVRLAVAINIAQNEIDRRLRGRYLVPFVTGLPSELKDIAITIAWYELYRGQGDTPDDVKNRYLDAIATLKGIAKGEITLDSDIQKAVTNSGISTSRRILIFNDDYY